MVNPILVVHPEDTEQFNLLESDQEEHQEKSQVDHRHRQGADRNNAGQSQEVPYIVFFTLFFPYIKKDHLL